MVSGLGRGETDGLCAGCGSYHHAIIECLDYAQMIAHAVLDYQLQLPSLQQ